MDYESLRKEAQRFPDTMSDAERAAAYAAGEEVDRIPFALNIEEPQAALYGYTMRQYRESGKVRLAVIEGAQKDFAVNTFRANNSLGLRGVGYALGSQVVVPEDNFEYIVEHVLTDYAMLDDMVFDPATNPLLQGYTNVVREMRELTDGKIPVNAGIVGPMSTAVSLRKPEFFLRDLVKDKKNAHRLLEFCVDCNLKWIRYNIEQFGPVAVSIADPFTAATLINMKSFHEFSRPYMEKMLAGIQELTGKIPGIHICGKTKPMWKELAEIGYPSFSVDNCEDLRELKEAVGDKMVVVGNVPPVDVLRFGSTDDVIASVIDCLIKASDSPLGYTLSVGCQIPVGTPRENLLAYAYAARRYGRGARKGQLPRGLIEEGLV